MPESLEQAVDALSASAMFREALGNEFVDHYVSVRRHEIGRFKSHIPSGNIASILRPSRPALCRATTSDSFSHGIRAGLVPETK